MRAPSRSRRSLAFALVGLLSLTLLAPTTALADTDLEVGGQAHIAYANGDGVRLRTGPGYDNSIITLFPEGSTVDVLDGPFTADDDSVWYQISVDGQTGYMVSDYLAAGPGSGSDSSSGDNSATVTTGLNLRTGPSFAAGVITVMPVGATVTLTGDSNDGFRSVSYLGTSGWAFDPYLDNGAYAGDTLGETQTTTDALNLRADPTLDADVLTVMAAGAAVTLTGHSANGFVSVDYNGRDGWASSDYLGNGTPSQPSSEPTPEPEPSGGSEIIWPMASGSGAWEITQGYNGPYSHQNESSTWQYYYSFDIARVDGDTAGQPVYSPVSGTIRWIDPAYGGMSIDLGNGYAFAYFHTYLADGLAAGQTISQGQYLGTIAAAGDAGNGGFSHIHITLWQTDDGGNWDRHAAPFTGEFTISGMDFPDTGGSNQYADTVIYP